jgi:hypothetical protein
MYRLRHAGYRGGSSNELTDAQTVVEKAECDIMDDLGCELRADSSHQLVIESGHGRESLRAQGGIVSARRVGSTGLARRTRSCAPKTQHRVGAEDAVVRTEGSHRAVAQRALDPQRRFRLHWRLLCKHLHFAMHLAGINSTLCTAQGVKMRLMFSSVNICCWTGGVSTKHQTSVW